MYPHLLDTAYQRALLVFELTLTSNINIVANYPITNHLRKSKLF